MFFKQTVDSIIADINAKIEKLHIVAEAHTLEAEAHDKIAAERQALSAFLKTEADRAKAIAGKLKALVS